MNCVGPVRIVDGGNGSEADARRSVTDAGKNWILAMNQEAAVESDNMAADHES
jgi:hypothetical protein